MTNPNVTFDDGIFNADGSFTPSAAHGKWQIIFKTATGLDYCRESRAAFIKADVVTKWAKQECKNHGLAGAVIERW